MGKSQLATIFMVVFIGLMGFSIMIPLMPSFAESFGASETTQGLLIASYALAQLIGAPILGRLSDRYGRRPILLVSVFGTFVSFLVMGFANALWVLFLARILDGLTGGNISVAQAYITDITDEGNRSRGLGLIGAAFGLGFIIGPALGGVLSAIGTNTIAPAVAQIEGPSLLKEVNWTYALPVFGAALITGINFLQVILVLPESLTAPRRAELAKSAGDQRLRRFSWSALREMIGRPRVGPLLNMRFFYGFSLSMLQTIFPIYAAVQLGLSPTETAFVLTYAGVMTVIVQAVLVGRLAQRYSDAHLLLMSAMMMSLAMLGWGLASTVPALLLVLLPISLAGGVFNTIINSALTKAVPSDEFGSVLGISTSLESATRVVAPTLGAFMIETLGSWSPGILGGFLTGLTAVYVWLKIIKAPYAVPIPAAQGEPLIIE